MSKLKNNIITALDVGSSKICCLIAERTELGTLKVLGTGYGGASGIKNGTIVDKDAAEHAIISAVKAAEEEARTHATPLFLSVCGGKPVSETHEVALTLGGTEITPNDIRKLLSQAKPTNKEGRGIIHKIPLHYQIDNGEVTDDPQGAYGQKLSALVHLISAETTLLRTLATCIKRCRLSVTNFVAAPFASGLACLSEEERETGSVVIDMGSHTTSIALFHGGKLQHVHYLHLGGSHVTSDIAQGLSTSLHDAERLKTLHGCALVRATTEREMLDVPVIDPQDKVVVNTISKAFLARIIQPRIEEIFEIVATHLRHIGMTSFVGQTIVLTGGGSLLPAVRDVGASILEGSTLRLGKPIAVLDALSPDCQTPVFSTVMGLLYYSQLPTIWMPTRDKNHPQKSHRWWHKTLHWLQENF